MTTKTPLPALAAVLVVAACGGASAPSDGQPAGPPPPSDTQTTLSSIAAVESAKSTGVLNDDTVLWPLDHAVRGGVTEEEFEILVDQLVTTCMRTRGWLHEEGASVARYVGEPETLGELRKYRQNEGYGLNGPTDEAATTDANLDYFRSLEEADQERYARDLEGGSDSCRLTAIGTVRAELGATKALDNRGLAVAQAAISGDRELQAARKRWSECMAAHGFDVTDQADAVDLAAEAGLAATTEAELAKAHLLELEIAGADFECAEQELLGAMISAHHAAIEQLLMLGLL